MPSDQYWKDKKKYDQIHHRGDYAPRDPKPADPVDPLAEAKLRIARLERALREQWEVYAANYLDDGPVQRLRAFEAMTKRLRELGISLPELPTKK